MATQTIEFRSPTSQTITAKLFAIGSDTVVATQSATEATNRKGTYSAAFTDVAAGTYELIAFVSTTPVARWYVALTLTTATFQATDTVTVESAISAMRGADNDTLKTLSDQIDGIDSGGLTVDQAATLDAIYDFTSGISGDQINVVGPVSSGGAIELILGKDYKVASESELTIAVTDTGGALHADLTSGTLASSKSFGASRENGDAVITGTIYSTTYATNVLTIKVEIDADQLPDTLPCVDDWTYQVHRVTSGGDEVVVLSGQLTTSMRTV